MKLHAIALPALLTMTIVSPTAASTTRPSSPVARPRAVVPASVTVGVTPQRLSYLETATFAATFSASRPGGGRYTATLELLPQGGSRPAARQDQGGIRLLPSQPVTVYWEWRSGATLPAGRYRVQVQLSDARGHTVARGTAPAPLLVAGRS
jgi:hypothetical protein